MKETYAIAGLIGIIVLLYGAGAFWLNLIMKSVALAFTSIVLF